MSTQIINLSLPKDLVNKIDKAASSQYASRSEYIRQAVVGRLRNEQDDSWDELVVLSDELSPKANQAGLVKDEDFVQAVKDVRANKRR
ncbi:MAG: ribbon-helix-helix domain-containing protein [Candidatus Saccharimonadales bacterium]